MNEAIVYIFLSSEGRYVPAGKLIQTDDNERTGSCEFRYGKKYLERQYRIAVDPIALPLPRNEEENVFVTNPPVTIFGAITDACPDQWGHYLMSKAAGKTALSEWECIMATGSDRVGALAFGPDLDGPQPIRPWPQRETPKHFDLEISYQAFQKIESNSEEIKEAFELLANRGGSVGGARPKATVEIDGESWLAKFPRRDDPREEVRAEFATMSLAKACGLNTPPFKVENIQGVDVFLIKRFDRNKKDGLEVREHFVSGLTLLNEAPLSAHHRSYGEIAARIQQLSAAPVDDCEELFARMLFNIMANNTDDHARNYGLLCQGEKWRLSPVYDVVVASNKSRYANQALGVGKSGRISSMENAMSDLASFGLQVKRAKEVLGVLQEKMNDWRSVFAQSGVSKEEIRQYEEQGFGHG